MGAVKVGGKFNLVICFIYGCYRPLCALFYLHRIVKFQSSQDAKRAVEMMHGLDLGSHHALEVRLDRK